MKHPKRISIWTPPLTEEFILNSIEKLNSCDIINIILYQTHLSVNFKVKLVEDTLYKLDKWDIQKVLLNSNSIDDTLKMKIKVILELTR